MAKRRKARKSRSSAKSHIKRVRIPGKGVRCVRVTPGKRPVFVKCGKGRK